MIDLDSYTAAAEVALNNLFIEWEPILMASHGLGVFELKDDDTIVTELDKNFETAIKDVLRPIDTNVGFMGEEHGLEGSTEIFWMVDPIDGTEQYTRGMPSCRTMLCLIFNGEPVYAYVNRFTTKDVYTAQKGTGTKKNGEHIKLVPRDIKRAWVEFSSDMSNPKNVTAMVAVSAATKAVVLTHEFLNVVDGSIDAYVVYGGQGKAWDYAPRALLMQESGLKVTNTGSDAYDYKNQSFIAAHPDVHTQLDNLLSPLA